MSEESLELLQKITIHREDVEKFLIAVQYLAKPFEVGKQMRVVIDYDPQKVSVSFDYFTKKQMEENTDVRKVTYKEITVLAEKRLDKVMELPDTLIFKAGVVEYMNVLLDMAGAKVFYETDVEYDGISIEERIRLVKKVRSYCEKLIESSFYEYERCGIPACRDVLGMIRGCDRWLKKACL